METAILTSESAIEQMAEKIACRIAERTVERALQKARPEDSRPDGDFMSNDQLMAYPNLSRH